MNTDENGYLVGVRYHDGQLLGVNLKNGDEALLTLTSVDGDESRLQIRGLHHLVINEFREGNTINAIYIWDFENLPAHVVKDFSRSGSIQERELLDQIKSHKYKVFYLECSYGAEIFATMKECRLIAP